MVDGLNAMIQSFDHLFVVNLNKLFNKQLSG